MLKGAWLDRRYFIPRNIQKFDRLEFRFEQVLLDSWQIAISDINPIRKK
jgi:hypothetical protein